MGHSTLLAEDQPRFTGPMDNPASYIHIGFVVISVPNLITLAVMFVLFAAALLLRLPGHRSAGPDGKEA